MPRPNGSFLAQLRGTMASGANPWTCSFALKATDTSAPGMANILHERFQANDGLYEGVLGMMNTQDSLIELTVYKYGAGGAVEQEGRRSINGAGQQARSHPKSTAFCVTLRTANISRSGRGRVYFPATGADISDGGLFGTAYPQYILDGLYNLVQDTSEEMAGLQVYSRTDGVSRDIITVDADRTPDRQEHRERNITAGRIFPTAI